MIIEVLRICRREINFLLLAPKELSLDCAQPSTYRVSPRLRSNRPGVYKLILSCYSTAFFSLPVTPASEPESRSILIP